MGAHAKAAGVTLPALLDCAASFALRASVGGHRYNQERFTKSRQTRGFQVAQSGAYATRNGGMRLWVGTPSADGSRGGELL